MCATGAVGLVKSNDLGSEKILAGCEVGKSDTVLALVGDQAVNSPLAIVTILGKLDPDIAGAVGLGWGDVDKDRALVRLYDC